MFKYLPLFTPLLFTGLTGVLRAEAGSIHLLSDRTTAESPYTVQDLGRVAGAGRVVLSEYGAQAVVLTAECGFRGKVNGTPG
jgi:hypothetical protein